MADTEIAWTHRPGTIGAVWNPSTGCDRISAGCANCYAITMAKRLKAMGQAKYQTDGDPRTSGPGFGVATHPDALTIPLRWRNPRTVFVDSMGDLFHARVPVEFVAKVWSVMARTPQHTYQILTKRPERMARLVGDELDGGQNLLSELMHEHDAIALYEAAWPLGNVWLGTSIENADVTGRIDHLRQTAAAVRLLSCEPLLGPLGDLDLTGIHWVIVGGESGANARPMNIDWMVDIIKQCLVAGVPVFVKQDTGRHSGQQGRIPDDIWSLKQYPQVQAMPA